MAGRSFLLAARAYTRAPAGGRHGRVINTFRAGIALRVATAAAERIDRGYLGRVLQVTLLAPDVVEAILDGRQREGLGMRKLMRSFPVDWLPGQRTAFADAAHRESPWGALGASWPSRGW
jgi:hypothetical protein